MLLLVEAAEDPADVGRDLASGHAKTPRRGSGPLTAPAAAAKEEQLAQHNHQQYQSSGLRRDPRYRPSEPGPKARVSGRVLSASTYGEARYRPSEPGRRRLTACRRTSSPQRLPRRAVRSRQPYANTSTSMSTADSCLRQRLSRRAAAQMPARYCERRQCQPPAKPRTQCCPLPRLRAGAARIRHKDYGWRIQGRATIPRLRTAAAAKLLAPTPRELATDCPAVPAWLCRLPPGLRKTLRTRP